MGGRPEVTFGLRIKHRCRGEPKRERWRPAEVTTLGTGRKNVVLGKEGKGADDAERERTHPGAGKRTLVTLKEVPSNRGFRKEERGNRERKTAWVGRGERSGGH